MERVRRESECRSTSTGASRPGQLRGAWLPQVVFTAANGQQQTVAPFTRCVRCGTGTRPSSARSRLTALGHLEPLLPRRPGSAVACIADIRHDHESHILCPEFPKAPSCAAYEVRHPRGEVSTDLLTLAYLEPQASLNTQGRLDFLSFTLNLFLLPGYSRSAIAAR